MSRERSSLDLEVEGNQFRFQLDQRPLLGWAVLFHTVGMLALGGAVASKIFWVVPIAGLMFLAGGAAFFVGLTWTQPATFLVSRAGLRVDGWSGFLAKRCDVVLPLESLRLRYATRARVNRRPVYRLVIERPDGSSMSVGGLACSREDLERLVDEVTAAQMYVDLEAPAGPTHAARGDDAGPAS